MWSGLKLLYHWRTSIIAVQRCLIAWFLGQVEMGGLGALAAQRCCANGKHDP